MNEYELYVPLYSNKGVRLPAARLKKLKKQLIKRFGGLTYFPQKTQGFWKIGSATFRDEIVIFRVIAQNNSGIKKFWRRLKARLKREWKEQDVLIVSRRVRVV